MVRETVAHRRALTQFGDALRRWRVIQGLPAQVVAERAGISRQQLSALEHGTGTPSTAALFAALEGLGLSTLVLDAIEPLNTELGRSRSELMGRKRVRVREDR